MTTYELTYRGDPAMVVQWEKHKGNRGTWTVKERKGFEWARIAFERYSKLPFRVPDAGGRTSNSRQLAVLNHLIFSFASAQNEAAGETVITVKRKGSLDIPASPKIPDEEAVRFFME